MSEGIRMRGSQGLVSIIAAINMGAGLSNASLLHALSVDQTSQQANIPRRAVIKKIMWSNRTGANTMLRIGYNSLATTFVQVLPDILMVNGVDGELNEDDLPICGNTPEGFMADTTALTGTAGGIRAGAVASGAAPNDVQVSIEVEEV